MMTKKQLRRDMLEKRKSLDLRQQHALIASMVEHFQQIGFIKLHKILSYNPIPGRIEVSAPVFEEAILEFFPDCLICYPAADFATGQMHAFADDEYLIWEEAAFGLTQPKNGSKVPAAEIDLILVPLLGFDKKGHRLGYGKGFYDRYLASCREDALKVGLSWFEPIEEMPEISGLDVPLSHCVTPHQLYVF
jgi:5-formyltetrahydrofolate cyclo-ligase